MLTINKTQTMLIPDKPELSAEASELGLAPGEWPDMIAVVNDDGEGFLYFENIRRPELHEYVTKDGRFLLTVFND